MRHLPKSRRLWLEELEPRLLLSADIAPLAAESPPFPETEIHQAVTDVLHAAAPAAAAPIVPGRFELVFVDAGVPDHAQLVADIAAQNDGWRRIEVVVLDPQRDGIAQVTEALAGRVQLDAVHFVTHGADGALQLGASRLDAQALADHEATVAGWGGSLKADGDLLFYGCDLAATPQGEAFLARLAALTAADVAASANLTGAQALGGDWRLEFTMGVVESEVAVSALAQGAWAGLLATQTLDWDLVANGTLPPAWDTASTAPHAYTVGGGNVTLSFGGDTGKINTGPIVDQFNEGGTAQDATPAIEYALHVGLDLDDDLQQVVWTIAFDHPGGVSNVGFTIFDIDVGGFVDMVTVSSDQGNPAITGSANNAVSGNTVTGTASAPQTGAGSADGNATFFFGQSGITAITIVYKHGEATNPTSQGISLHDISFDPTPSASDSSVTLNEDATYAFSVADFGFADVDGDTLQSVRITQVPVAGTLFIAGVGNVTAGQTIPVADLTAGNLRFTPAAGANGAPYASFRFQVGDGASFSTSDYQMAVNVTAVNDAPVLAGANDLAGIDEDDATSAGTLVSALIAGQVTDDDSGALAGIAVTAVDNANGAWQYSLDGGGIWADFVAPSAAAARLLADDPNTRVRFVPNADWNGTATIDFRAWDRTSGVPGGTGDAAANGDATAFSAAPASASIAVSAVTDTVDDAAATNEDDAVTVDVLANDTFENAGRTLTGVAGAVNGGVVFDASGSVTYTPNANWNGTETLTYTVSAGGVTETGTLTITVNPVNDAPSFALGADQTVNEDAAAQTVAAFASGSPGGGPDEASQILTYTVTNDNNLLFAEQPAIAADGTLTYAAAANAHGTATVSVFLSDGGGTANGGVDTSPTQTFTITVAPVADTPAVTNAATLEDTQSTSGLVITRNAADGTEVTHYKITAISGGTLFLDDGTTVVTTGSFVTAAQGAAGLRFTPAPDAVTAGSFGVQASVAGSDAGLGGGTVTATIAVTPVNDTPSFILAGNQAVNEDAGAQLVALFAVGSPGGGPDEASQILTYTVTNDNSALFAAQPAIAADGTLTYTPSADASGTATVTVFVKDDGGTLNGEIDASAAQTFTITVTPIADAPAVVIAPAAGDEDSPIALTVNPALVDTDGSESLAVSISAIPVGATLTDGLNGFTASAGNQSVIVSTWNLAGLSITPPANSDTDFTLTVSATATEGANGDTATANASLAVAVEAIADAPAVVIAPAAGDEDSPIALTVNPALVDTDGSESLAVSISAIPVGATLTDGLNSFTASAGDQSVIVSTWNLAGLSITPPADSDTDFMLTVSATAAEGANGATATTTVALGVDVVPVNDAPVLAANAGLTVDEGAAGAITPAMLQVTDVDDAPAQLAYTVTAAPVNGRLALVSAPGMAITSFTQDDLDNGRVRYVHDGSETLADGFTFTVSDGAGGAIGATGFAIAVNPVNDAPALVTNRLTIGDGQTVVVTAANLVAVDPDNPLADLGFTVSAVQNGRFQLAGAPGVPITAFTYNQLAAGQVQFVHAGGNQVPGYVVTPNDGTLAGAALSAAITFLPSLGTADGFGALTRQVGAGDDAITVLVPPAPSTSTGASLASPSMSDAAPIPRGLADFEPIMLPEAPILAAPTRVALAAGDAGFAKIDPKAEYEPLQVLRMPGPIVDLHPTQLDYADVQSRGDVDALMGSVKMAGLVLSVGIIWWATRAAGLIASALSALPAWRNFDPIFVVGRDEDDDFRWETPQDEEAEREEEAVAETMADARPSVPERERKHAQG